MNYVKQEIIRSSGCWICQNPASTSAHTHTHSLTHSLTHCCTTTRDTVAAFSKGKDKYNTVSGSSVRYANTQSSSRMRYTHTAKHFEWSHTAGRRFSLPRGPGFSPAWFGQPSMEEEVRLRNEGRRTASSRQQPSSCGYWIWSTKKPRPNKQCLNATFCNLRIWNVVFARLGIRFTEGNHTNKKENFYKRTELCYGEDVWDNWRGGWTKNTEGEQYVGW